MPASDRPCSICGVRPRYVQRNGKTCTYCRECDSARASAYYHAHKVKKAPPTPPAAPTVSEPEQPRDIPTQRADELRRLMAQQSALLRLQSEQSATGHLPPMTNLYCWR